MFVSCSVTSERRQCSNFLRERKANLVFPSFSECDLSSLVAGWMQHEKQRCGSPRKNAKKKMCKSHILQQNLSKLVIKYRIVCWCRTGRWGRARENSPEYWEYFPVKSCEMGVEELSSVGNIFIFWINYLDAKLGVLLPMKLWGFLVSSLQMAQGGNKITLKSRSFVWSQRNFIAEIVLWFSGGKEISRMCLWLN